MRGNVTYMEHNGTVHADFGCRTLGYAYAHVQPWLKTAQQSCCANALGIAAAAHDMYVAVVLMVCVLVPTAGAGFGEAFTLEGVGIANNGVCHRLQWNQWAAWMSSGVCVFLNGFIQQCLMTSIALMELAPHTVAKHCSGIRQRKPHLVDFGMVCSR